MKQDVRAKVASTNTIATLEDKCKLLEGRVAELQNELNSKSDMMENRVRTVEERKQQFYD